MSINIYAVNVAEIDETKINNMSQHRQDKYYKLKQINDKRLCVGAGIVLDYALRHYGLKESDMTYTFNENGKPSLADYPDICFSVSHSGDYAVCAIGDSPLGCDIEKIGRLDFKTANRCFSPSECNMLCNLSPDKQKAELTRLWTIKESYAKLMGEGIASVISADIKNMNYNINTYNDIDGYVLSCCSIDNDIKLHIIKSTDK